MSKWERGSDLKAGMRYALECGLLRKFGRRNAWQRKLINSHPGDFTLAVLQRKGCHFSWFSLGIKSNSRKKGVYRAVRISVCPEVGG